MFKCNLRQFSVHESIVTSKPLTKGGTITIRGQGDYEVMGCASYDARGSKHSKKLRKMHGGVGNPCSALPSDVMLAVFDAAPLEVRAALAVADPACWRARRDDLRRAGARLLSLLDADGYHSETLRMGAERAPRLARLAARGLVQMASTDADEGLVLINIKENAVANWDEPLLIFLGCLMLRTAEALVGASGEHGRRRARQLLQLIAPAPHGPHTPWLIRCARTAQDDEWEERAALGQ